MPQIRPDAIALGVLLMCVPLQYILVKYWGRTEVGRTHALNEFIHNLVKFHSNYLQWDAWKQWCFTTFNPTETEGNQFAKMYSSDLSDPYGESPAIEVMKYKQKEGFFALSPEPRTHRLPNMKFRIGQVVTHKLWKYRGVIIGWDDAAKAPAEWLDSMYGNGEENLMDMPNYSVLVDVRDRLSPQITYVPEENLIPVKNTRVIHPLLDDHFEDFDGAQYIPRPWLKAVYPKD